MLKAETAWDKNLSYGRIPKENKSVQCNLVCAGSLEYAINPPSHSNVKFHDQNQTDWRKENRGNSKKPINVPKVDIEKMRTWEHDMFHIYEKDYNEERIETKEAITSTCDCDKCGKIYKAPALRIYKTCRNVETGAIPKSFEQFDPIKKKCSILSTNSSESVFPKKEKKLLFKEPPYEDSALNDTVEALSSLNLSDNLEEPKCSEYVKMNPQQIVESLSSFIPEVNLLKEKEETAHSGLNSQLKIKYEKVRLPKQFPIETFSPFDYQLEFNNNEQEARVHPDINVFDVLTKSDSQETITPDLSNPDLYPNGGGIQRTVDAFRCKIARKLENSRSPRNQNRYSRIHPHQMRQTPASVSVRARLGSPSDTIGYFGNVSRGLNPNHIQLTTQQHRLQTPKVRFSTNN